MNYLITNNRTDNPQKVKHQGKHAASELSLASATRKPRLRVDGEARTEWCLRAAVPVQATKTYKATIQGAESVHHGNMI